MRTAHYTQTEAHPPLVAGQRLDRATFHQRYEAMPPETRAELINGVVHIPSPLSHDHAGESTPFASWLDRYMVYTPGTWWGITPSVLLDDRAEPQPDFVLTILPECGGRTRIEGGYLAGPPELVIEVARSSRHTDLGPKKADYQRAGVPEYLVFELGPDRVHWFILRDGRYELLTPGDDGLYRSVVFPGLWLDPEALIAQDRFRLWEALDRGLATNEHQAFVDRLSQARERS